MPNYVYACPTNGQTVEVMHPMSETIETWGQLCARAEVDAGSTPTETPVHRVIGGVAAHTGGESGNLAPMPCGKMSCACRPE